MQFEEILQDCLEFFNIPPAQHGSHFLVDKKTSEKDFHSFIDKAVLVVEMKCEAK